MAPPLRVLLVAAMLVTGCARFELKPLTPNHPANPDAIAAPQPVRSRTLAYGPADIPSPVVPSTAAVAPGDHHAAGADASSSTVVAEGEVIATVPHASQLVLEHGEIKGFMEPMTMGFRVEPPSLLERLKPGDSIRFTIDVHRRA